MGVLRFCSSGELDSSPLRCFSIALPLPFTYRQPTCDYLRSSVRSFTTVARRSTTLHLKRHSLYPGSLKMLNCALQLRQCIVLANFASIA